MQRLPAQMISRLRTVFLALCLVLAALQPASVHSLTMPQHNTVHVSAQNEHNRSLNAASHCSIDCVSTMHHCCLYALCNNSSVAFFKQNLTYNNRLPYFFSSRAITPVIPPPKA